MKKLKKRLDYLDGNKFNPQLEYYELEYLVNPSNLEKKIENTQVRNLVKNLTDLAYPSSWDEYSKQWFDFYLPLKRRGCLISLSFKVVEYQKEFFVNFQGLGNLHIRNGKEKVEKQYKTIFREALRFIPLIKRTKNVILEGTIPYDIRTGKIKGKYILEKLMPEREKEEILLNYGIHLKKRLKISQISLKRYLNVAAICYKAAFRERTRNLSSLEMYKKWADGRDGGMLSIKDWESTQAFKNWQGSGEWEGSHPFEIVFSWHGHGIHLFPPNTYSHHHWLRITNYAYAENFIRIVRALIKKGVPFQAKDLKDVLDYLTGETYFTVNDYSEHCFYYIPKEHKELYFRHIKWDEIKVPKWINKRERSKNSD